MRGYFGIGVEQISKAGNLGNLIRSAHSFGASYFFTVDPAVRTEDARCSDTSSAFDHMPVYDFDGIDDIVFPKGVQLVGVELIDDSIELPSFTHPTRAAYILGPEMGSLSTAIQDKCDHIVHIPMKFCVNVGVAGALVMYDRMLTKGRFPPRPVRAGGPVEELPIHKHGPHRKFRSSL